jgi:ribonuclease P protein component
LDVRAAASLHAFSRVGFVVPKYKHTGVERNRLKRRLREIVRLEVLPVLHADGTAQDLVLRVFPSAYGRDMATLRSEVLQAMRRLGG